MNKIILGVVALVVIIGGGWYVYSSKQSGSEATAGTETSTNTQAVGQASAYHDNIYLSKTDPAKGSYMTDFAGMTLYTFDKDTSGVSNCSGGCAAAWPPYISGSAAQGQFPTGISVITRADGSQQFAWQGKPLYYYAKDKQAGDLTGDGVGGTWHIVSL